MRLSEHPSTRFPQQPFDLGNRNIQKSRNDNNLPFHQNVGKHNIARYNRISSAIRDDRKPVTQSGLSDRDWELARERDIEQCNLKKGRLVHSTIADLSRGEPALKEILEVSNKVKERLGFDTQPVRVTCEESKIFALVWKGVREFEKILKSLTGTSTTEQEKALQALPRSLRNAISTPQPVDQQSVTATENPLPSFELPKHASTICPRLGSEYQSGGVGLGFAVGTGVGGILGALVAVGVIMWKKGGLGTKSNDTSNRPTEAPLLPSN